MQAMHAVVALAMLSAVGLAPASALAAIPVRCEEEAINPERTEVRCTLASDQATRRYRLEVRFSGSHDDTSASLSATLNGIPLSCGPNSKTKLFGDDGEVSLWCDFEVGASGEPSHRLEGVIAYRHAQYGGTRLLPQTR